MTEPKLHEWYSAEQAISFFGPPSEAQRLCNGQWLIFSTTVVCLTTIGEGPKASHFESGSRFCWVADQPYRVSDKRGSCFVPEQIFGGAETKHAIRLFVRPPQARDYMYAGELELSRVLQSPGRENHGMAWFALKPTLPSSVWTGLGGLRFGDLDFASLDLALDRLRHPTTVQDRLGILQRLVNYWHGPIRPEDGMSDDQLAGQRLPMPLYWWYRWAGKRLKVMNRQNRLFIPRDYQRRYGQLTIKNGRLVFYAENQGVYEWSTLPDGEDPPVFGRYECKGRWARERIALSEHLILMCLFEAVLCHGNYGASAAWLHKDRLAAIVRDIPPLAIRPWRWNRTRFFVGRGAFVCAAENARRNTRADHFSVWIAAKTEHPLAFLKPYIDDKWECVTI